MAQDSIIDFSAHHPVKIKSLFCLLCLQVVANVFFKGSLNNHAHVAVTLLIVAACTALSLAYDCLGIVLVLNVSRMTFWIVVTYFYTKITMVIFLTILFFFCLPGCCKRHTFNFHHSISLLPQAFHRALVPRWKPHPLSHPHSWCLCHDNRFDHGGYVPPRLLPWSRDVLLRNFQPLHIPHTTHWATLSEFNSEF